MKKLTINLNECTIQVEGNNVVQWRKGSLRKELKNQLDRKVKQNGKKD